MTSTASYNKFGASGDSGGGGGGVSQEEVEELLTAYVQRPGASGNLNYVPVFNDSLGRTFKRAKIRHDGTSTGRIEFMDGAMQLPLTGGGAGQVLAMSDDAGEAATGLMEFKDPVATVPDDILCETLDANTLVSSNTVRGLTVDSTTNLYCRNVSNPDGDPVAVAGVLSAGNVQATIVGAQTVTATSNLNVRYIYNPDDVPFEFNQAINLQGQHSVTGANQVVADEVDAQLVNALSIITGDISTATVDGVNGELDLRTNGVVRVESNIVDYGPPDGAVFTVDVFDPSGFAPPISIDGQTRYQLNNNTTYIFHGSQTYTSGFAFGSNCSIRGADFSATIVFDEASKDITGFYSRNENVYLSQLTVVGGGGHFSESSGFVGLFDCENFDLGAPPPFYGRNRRFKVTNTNILKPRKFGRIKGFGTVNITNNFFNGGGGDASPGAVYTREGFEVSDGLSLEYTQNKVVLFYGAQAPISDPPPAPPNADGTLLNLVDSEPLLGFNAVNIGNNIFHPRNGEKGLSFGPFSNTKLGNITGNNFIRTGGQGDLISYVGYDNLQNYNAQPIRYYEVFGNAGIADSNPSVNCAASFSNSFLNSAITFPTENILSFKESRRFGVTYHLAGLTQPVVTGQHVVITAFISGFTVVRGFLVIGHDDFALGGNQDVQLADFDAPVPNPLDITSIAVFDRDLTTSIASATSCILGNGGNGELELVYLDALSPNFVILTANINMTAGQQNDSHRFLWGKSTLPGGAGYVNQDGTSTTTTPTRPSPAEFSLVVTVAQTMQVGDRYKLFSTQIDGTSATIQSININGK